MKVTLLHQFSFQNHCEICRTNYPSVDTVRCGWTHLLTFPSFRSKVNTPEVLPKTNFDRLENFKIFHAIEEKKRKRKHQIWISVKKLTETDYDRGKSLRTPDLNCFFLSRFLKICRSKTHFHYLFKSRSTHSTKNGQICYRRLAGSEQSVHCNVCDLKGKYCSAQSQRTTQGCTTCEAPCGPIQILMCTEN